MKVVVAMSGGVDSSVAAALLKREGHEVIGATLLLYPQPDNKRAPESDTAECARKMAEYLGIPHHIIDLRDFFTRTIIDSFCREYRLGRTPNPCIRCNKLIKFGILMEKAIEMGADFLATGHYARIETDGSGKFLLKKGRDITKDQSYFLCKLNQEQLSHTLFPIGNLTKSKVRQTAREMAIPSADRPESQEICFIPDNDYAGFIQEHAPAPAEPGPILDSQGNTVGRHRGIEFYTVGQRKGLGIAAARPLYVTTIEPERNAVIVGEKEATYTDGLVADDLNWIGGAAPEFPLTIKARVRYRHPEAEATVNPINETQVHVKFTKPQMAITPGQTVAFYDGDTVTGGGTICKQGRKL